MSTMASVNSIVTNFIYRVAEKMYLKLHNQSRFHTRSFFQWSYNDVVHVCGRMTVATAFDKELCCPIG